ncbi:MAG TPA: AMP-binding protein [Thermoanaerobaculia bacterium]|nr:AMP-binding protein [Thermoanaerobaculia bacterium]
MNFWDLLLVARQRDPTAPALQLADGRTYSHAELHAAAERWAAVLLTHGVEPGERVALWLGNREETVLAYLAALRLGAVAVPLNLAYRRGELAHVLADASPRLLLTDREQLAVLDEIGRDVLGTVPLELVEDLAKQLGTAPVAVEGPEVGRAGGRAPSRPQRLREDGWDTPRQAGPHLGPRSPDQPPPAVPAPPRSSLLPLPPSGVAGDDLAMLLYTSGTTGRSKGAMLTHNNLLATVTGLLAAWAWEPRDRLLLTLPIFHTHGLVVGLFTALAAGASVRLRRRFDAAAVIAELAANEATLFFGVPTMYVRLVEALQAEGAGDRLRDVRLFCCGSAPLAPETFNAFAAATGHQILERYGMTETGMLLSNPYAGERLPGTVGTPLPGVSLRIVDRDDSELPAGEEGELHVRGSNVFAGYWRDEAKTAESFAVDEVGNRWFRTGDLGRVDPATGHVTLLGRGRELILRGGFNVYPREVEEVLELFPAVREAAVVGRPHPEWGEVPVAFLVVEIDIEVDEGALLAHCAAELARFKLPVAFRYVEALPRNALGKVQKHLLPP